MLGTDPSPAYSCLVGTEVLPSESCAEHVERPGRTASLLRGNASNDVVPLSLRDAKVPPRPPLPDHCQEPVNLCGRGHLYDAHYVTCPSNATLDPEQLVCLTELTTLIADGTAFERFSREQHFEHLASAHFSRTNLSELGPLAQAHELVSLGVSHTRVTDLGQLRHATKLRILDMVGIEVAQLNVLLGLTALTELRVDPSMVDPGQLQQLREARGPALRILDQNGQPLTGKGRHPAPGP